MVKSRLCHYCDAYIPVSRTITAFGAGSDQVAQAADTNEKQAIFRNCAPFAN